MIFKQNNKICNGLAPISVSTTGTGDYISMKNYNHFTCLLHVGVNSATGTTVSLQKATSTTGAGATDATFWYAYNTSATTGDTWTETTGGTSITMTSGSGYLYSIELDGASLGDYDCLALKVSPASGALLASYTYILSEPRYADGAMPTAITD